MDFAKLNDDFSKYNAETTQIIKGLEERAIFAHSPKIDLFSLNAVEKFLEHKDITSPVYFYNGAFHPEADIRRHLTPDEISQHFKYRGGKLFYCRSIDFNQISQNLAANKDFVDVLFDRNKDWGWSWSGLLKN